MNKAIIFGYITKDPELKNITKWNTSLLFYSSNKQGLER